MESQDTVGDAPGKPSLASPGPSHIPASEIKLQNTVDNASGQESENFPDKLPIPELQSHTTDVDSDMSGMTGVSATAVDISDNPVIENNLAIEEDESLFIDDGLSNEEQSPTTTGREKPTDKAVFDNDLSSDENYALVARLQDDEEEAMQELIELSQYGNHEDPEDALPGSLEFQTDSLRELEPPANRSESHTTATQEHRPGQATEASLKRKLDPEANTLKKRPRTTGAQSTHWPPWPRKVAKEPGRTQAQVLQRKKATKPMNRRLEKTTVGQIKSYMAESYDTRRVSSQNKDLQDAEEVLRCTKIAGARRLVPGMKTSLMDHQMPVVSWMVKRERANSSPSGGIIGDDMGMGKTLVSIACVMAHLPDEETIKEYSRATLIVLPNRAIARQWQSEIREHCVEGTKSILYAGNKDIVVDSELDRHFVLTTYAEVMHQYPSKTELSELRGKYGEDSRMFDRELFNKLGRLFHVDWYRVILDEAHTIKNVKGITSMACCRLSMKYSWALSGTPLANTPEEFFPYLKFIGCRFARTASEFKETYVDCVNAERNFDALAALTLYRRTHNDTFLGKKIVDLQESETRDIWVPLSTQEEIIYMKIEGHFESALKAVRKDKKLSDKEKKKKMKRIRHAMCVRLRQVVSHCFTLESFFRFNIDADFITSLMKQLSGASKTAVLETVRGGVPQVIREIFHYGLEKVMEHKDPVFGGHFDINSILRYCHIERQHSRYKCAKCHDAVTAEAFSLFNKKCKHSQCVSCSEEEGCSEEGDTPACTKKTQCPSKGCNAEWRPTQINTLVRVMGVAASRKKKSAEPGTDHIGTRIITRVPEENGFFTAAATVPRVNTTPSSKLTMAMAVLFQWQRDFPQDKTIVFTQWLATAKVLGCMLEKTKTKFVYYYGTVSDDRRKVAIKAFNDDPSIKILIAGIKCGGQSLNLTIANRVLLIDPWWNTTIEEQAFGRVKRIGQKKKTQMCRIFSNSQIEERVHELQVKKSRSIASALQDDKHQISCMDDDDLEKLFSVDDASETECEPENTGS